jgi:hypothetical protein
MDGARRERPNPPFQPTPLRVDKIGAILRARIGYNAIAIYRCGAAEWQTVSPQLIKLILI